MTSPDIDLSNLYITQVHQLATQAQEGANIETELSILIHQAIDHFAKIFNPAQTLEHFIGQLKFQAGLAGGLHAETLRKAASIASRASTEQEN